MTIRQFAVKSLGTLALVAAFSTSASASLVSSGVADIPGTYLFDFDAGSISSVGADVFWEQYTSTTRAIVAVNGAQIVNLGAVNFASISAASLAGLTYGSTPISGSDTGSQLTYGDVFAIHTTSGNYAKAIVAFPFFDPNQNHGLPIYWETFSAAAVPEPESYAMLLAGLGLMGTIVRRRTGQ